MSSAGASAQTKRRGSKWTLAISLLGAAVLITAGFVVWNELSAPDEPRFLSTSEAQRVAVSRFNNFDEGTREIEVEVADPRGVITGAGVFDYASGAGIAKFDIGDGTQRLIWWNYDIVGERMLEDSEASLAELTASLDASDGWNFSTREEAVSSALGPALIFIAGFSLDRPDNPKLIEQSDAVWLSGEDGGERDWVQLPSADEVRGKDAVPAKNPGVPRVLIDAEGVVQEARLGASGAQASEVRFGAAVRDSVEKLDLKASESAKTADAPDDLDEAG